MKCCTGYLTTEGLNARSFYYTDQLSQSLHDTAAPYKIIIIIIIIDNFCIALFSGVPKLTALYILQHFLSFTNIIHIIMTTNNV